jgi:hypothetical protein
VLGQVEVAGRDRRQAALGDPVEALVAVEELEPVDRFGSPLAMFGEAGGASVRGRRFRERIRMRRDQRRSSCTSVAQGGF